MWCVWLVGIRAYRLAARQARWLQVVCGAWPAGVLGSLWSLLCVAPVYAQPTTSAIEQDANKWSTIHLNFTIDDDWKAGVGLHNRIGNDLSALRRNRVRGLLSRRVSESLVATIGYDRIENYNPRNAEDRTFLQLEYDLPPVGQVSLSVRNRLEQRWVKDVSGMLHRNRTMISGTYPLDLSGRFYAVGWSELFLLLNSQPEWPQGTWDQSRLFAGVGYHINERSRFEAGYQMRYHRFAAERGNRLNHILFLQYFHNF